MASSLLSAWSGRVSATLATLSRRCSTEEVPGISRIWGSGTNTLSGDRSRMALDGLRAPEGTNREGNEYEHQAREPGEGAECRG